MIFSCESLSQKFLVTNTNTRKRYIRYFLFTVMFWSCGGRVKKSEILCTDSRCDGIYIGPEFLYGTDIAHQFSNKICKCVGDRLKELYKAGKYSKVDFEKIRMTTEGMGSGKVTYKINIPFIRVEEKCQAYTSFDHVGGWNHEPGLSGRKAQLKRALMKNDTLYISPLMRTKEGLQEYWIQWKNKDLQAECGN